MAYNPRSLRSVRQVTPESSLKLRDASKLLDLGFTGPANQVATQAARDLVSERGTSNPMERKVKEGAQKALIASQQAAIQGNYNDDIVAPLRQEWFTGADNLPTFKQTALYNKYTPEIMQQQLMGQQQQKSFLQLKEAQRKARMSQAADALQVPVSQRLQEIMGSGTPLKQKYSDIQQSLLSNPSALGSPLLASLYQTTLQSVGNQLSDEQKQDNMENAMRINLAYKAIEIGDSKTAQDLLSFKEGKSSSLQDYAKNLADSKKRYDAGTSSSKNFNTLLNSLEKVPLREAQDILKPLRKNQNDLLMYRAFIKRKTKAERDGVDDSSVNAITSLITAADMDSASEYRTAVKTVIDLNPNLKEALQSIGSATEDDPSKTTGKTTGGTLYDDITSSSAEPDQIKALLYIVLANIQGDTSQIEDDLRGDKENKFASLVNN
jgi:hypothetical protein